MYDDLLASLLATPDKLLTIQVGGTVTTAAIRQGLKAAFKKFNQQMELCDIPTIKGSVSVSNPDAEGTITIRILTATPQAKFKFTIIE